ncbi:methyltransferase [Saccharopolyspora taberi]|uniref:Methyltransferase n=1 Tax=Saccharopolyspora taberi TaxID=60895 RepID=A0ABN3VHL7_9PSEU
MTIQDRARLPEAPDDGAANDRGRLLSMCFGYVASRILHAAVRLRIPDALADDEHSGTELAAVTAARPDSLRRLLRGLEHIGVITETRPDHFALTPMGHHLRSEDPGSVGSMIELFCAPQIWRAWESLDQAVRTGETGFTREFGAGFYDHCAQDPSLATALRDGLGQEALKVAPALATAVDFSRFRTLVDIGGGNGALLSAVLAANPALRGVLVDTATGSEPDSAPLREAGVGQRCEHVVADFFRDVPTGGDAYLLKSVIQDWDDEPALQILRTCRRAMSSHARLLLVEYLRDARPPTASDVPLRDLLLLTTSGGHVRSEKEFADLLARSGFQLVSTTPVDRSYHVVEAAPSEIAGSGTASAIQ